jgi:serine/threonine protein kinase
MDRFREIRVIGRGNYGIATLVEDLECDLVEKDGEGSGGDSAALAPKGPSPYLVVKKLPMADATDKERDAAMLEVALLSSLRHPCIVEYRGSFIQDGSLHILMEYCDGGDLGTRIRTAKTGGIDEGPAYFTEEQVMDWFVQLVRRFLHFPRGNSCRSCSVVVAFRCDALTPSLASYLYLQICATGIRSCFHALSSSPAS